jgi:glycerol uptake operon antiterminator
MSAAMSRRLAIYPYCAAVKSETDLELALSSRAEILVILRGDGLSLADPIRRAHANGKLVAVHLDLVDGVGDDLAGARWLLAGGADAIVSSHSQVIHGVKAAGGVAIQRLLLVDARSLDSGLIAIGKAMPDFVEVLPGGILPDLRQILAGRLAMPILVGGFISSRVDAAAVLDAGAVGVTTSSRVLWG